METRANYVLIGFFTLAVLAGAFSFVHWFRSVGKGGPRASYHVTFQGPVGGLRTGGAVLFNGMRVGEVSALDLAKHDPRQVVATINIDANVPVRKDTYVGLDFQGLTGIASVALKGGDLTAAPLPEGDDGVPMLVADASATQDLTAAAREVLRKMDAVVGENQAALHNAVANIEEFTAVLKNNTERLDHILGSVDRVMSGVEVLTGNGEKAGELTETVRTVRSTVDDFDKKTLRNFDLLIGDGRRTLATIEQVMKNFDRNPTRLLFGGGSSATDASQQAPKPPRRATPQ